MIYLDNAATTPLKEEVLESMLPWLRSDFGNPSSLYLPGRKARVAVESAREEIASFVNAHPSELFFTSGGTESNNAILRSAFYESRLVSSFAAPASEHHSVLHPLRDLSSQGASFSLIPVNCEGRVVPDSLLHFNQRSVLVSVMHANNETGVIQDLALVKEHVPEAFLHSDCVQSLGKVSVNVEELRVDFASFSAHKIHGPKGIGAMYVRRGIDFKAHQSGGAQERNRRAGTEAVALIVGMATAVRLACDRIREFQERSRLLSDLLRKRLAEIIPGVRFNTPQYKVLPNILNVSFPGGSATQGESILQMLDMQGVCVSNGSACVSGSQQASHVLLAMGLPVSEASMAIRFSFSFMNATEDVEAAVVATEQAYQSTLV